MGSFSFICQKSGKPIRSTACDGDGVYLFLLRDGKVIEEMYGNYDSYGSVFSQLKKEDEDGIGDSFKWSLPWNEVCKLIFSNSMRNGIAAILSKHWDGEIPTEKSENDPDQGFSNKKVFKQILKPYHKVY